MRLDDTVFLRLRQRQMDEDQRRKEEAARISMQGAESAASRRDQEWQRKSQMAQAQGQAAGALGEDLGMEYESPAIGEYAQLGEMIGRGGREQAMSAQRQKMLDMAMRQQKQQEEAEYKRAKMLQDLGIAGAREQGLIARFEAGQQGMWDRQTRGLEAAQKRMNTLAGVRERTAPPRPSVLSTQIDKALSYAAGIGKTKAGVLEEGKSAWAARWREAVDKLGKAKAFADTDQKAEAAQLYQKAMTELQTLEKEPPPPPRGQQGAEVPPYLQKMGGIPQ